LPVFLLDRAPRGAYYVDMKNEANNDRALEELIYVLANGTTGRAHLAEEQNRTGARTGTVLATYHVARCSGRMIGGAWGYTLSETLQDRALCARCARIVQ